MMNSDIDNISIGIDGSLIDKKTKESFNLVQGIDSRFNNKKLDSEVYDFVGLVCKQNKNLVVFPKHFYNSDKSTDKSIFKLDITLLFKTIFKYIESKDSKADKYAGYKDSFDADFPFSSFFSIYNYFKRYGIYKERFEKTKIGYNGKISWKKTIQKSNKLVSNGNIIHLPIYVRQKKSKYVFISDVMSFAIDYTIERFSFIFSLQKSNYNHSRIDFIKNSKYVIRELQNLKSYIFKDINLKLINDLINFYDKLDSHNYGGDIHVKIKYFNLVWEEMVANYLNKHFVCFDKGKKQLFFDNKQKKSKIIFRKKTFIVDDSSNKYQIEPDHYFIDDNMQYIFDAKYYSELKYMNYKQFSYHEILKNKSAKNNTISALIVPSHQTNSARIHFSLKDEFSDNNEEVVIYIQELDIKQVMKSYVE